MPDVKTIAKLLKRNVLNVNARNLVREPDCMHILITRSRHWQLAAAVLGNQS